MIGGIQPGSISTVNQIGILVMRSFRLFFVSVCVCSVCVCVCVGGGGWLDLPVLVYQSIDHHHQSIKL